MFEETLEWNIKGLFLNNKPVNNPSLDIVYNILQSINLLSDAMHSFNKKCLSKIKANKKNIQKHVNNSLMLVTALNQYIGYDNAAKIAKKAFKENITLKKAALKLKLIDEKEFDKLVNPKKMV